MMGDTIKSDLIVFYQCEFGPQFLVLIKDVCGFISMTQVLEECGQKYGFLPQDLTGVWVNHSYLDYQKDIVNV